MNILILGSGGREHSLAWAVKQNPKTDRLIVAPGNAGIALLAECADIDILSGQTVVTFCEENAIDFVIVGPEAPLAAGVADATRAAGILTFGPSAAAARLEASKAFTKEICDACAAPTAAWARFTESAPAKAYIQAQGAPIVVSGWDMGVSLAIGALILAFGMVMYTLGSRVIPAAELTLLSLIEVLLAPMWVFLFLGETASAATFVGGGVLLAAVALNAVMGARSQMAGGLAKVP